MFDVFLSHNSRQKPWVRELAQMLKNGGLKIFFDEESISPGEDVGRALESALENSRHVVFVITRSSLASDWVALETASTIYGDPAARKRVLIPVLLERIDRNRIPFLIRRLNSVDLSNPDTRQANLAKLLKYLGLDDSAIVPMSHWPNPDRAPVNLTVADSGDVFSWGWEGNKLLEELIRIDYATLHELKEHHEGNIAQWSPVFTDHPDTWRLLTTSPGTIVGYWHFVPLFDPEYEKAKLGRLLDSEITADKVRFFELPGRYNIYFVSISVLAQCKGVTAFRLLIDSISTQMAELASKGIFINEVCANAYTETGVSLCQTFGLTYERDHIERGKIYVGSFERLSRDHLSAFNPPLSEFYPG